MRLTTGQEARQEGVLGRDGTGGQLRSFEWVFSLRRADGTPAYLFDRSSGAVDPVVAAYWRDHYDLGYRLKTGWHHLRHNLSGKIDVRVGTADSFYLDSAVYRPEAAFRAVGGRAEFTYVSDASHGLTEVYVQDGDRNGYWWTMTREMYAVARPRRGDRRP